jgi:hypothetical protein
MTWSRNSKSGPMTGENMFEPCWQRAFFLVTGYL